ncbi:MAG TPA: hypothetical protein VGL19_03865 [Polyangiaceae bacterium]
MALSLLLSRAASAAGAPHAVAAPMAAASAPGPVSPFTGQAQPAPALPPPPPPAAAPTASPDRLPLPPPPPPRAATGPAAAPEPAATPPAVESAPVRPGAPGSDLPAPPRAARGVHLHDSFYLRMGLGLAGSGALVSSDSKSLGDYSFAGAGGTADLWIGGTPTPGLAMGAALSVLGLNSQSRSVDGKKISGDVSGSTGLLGFFVDGFPDPERGFHFGGALGVASGSAQIKDDANKFDGGGVGLEGWVGYDFWVAPQWSIGGMGRFMGSITRQDANGVNYETSMGGASLSFTALYH